MSGPLTSAQVQSLIDATSLSALQGQVSDGQIPAAIMRDAEFTAAAVRNLLSLSATEVNDILTGASISGQTLTFTQNDGSTVPITIPPGTGGMADGVVESGVFNAAGTELTLTLDTGGTVTIDVPAALRAGVGAAVVVQDEGTEVEDGLATINFTGAGVTAAMDSDGVVTVNIPGGSTPPTPTHTSYAAVGADTTWTEAEFQAGTNGAGNSLAVPTYTGSMHVGFARPVSAGTITEVYFYAMGAGRGQDQIGAWTVQMDTLDIGGEDHYVVYSNNALSAISGIAFVVEVT